MQNTECKMQNWGTHHPSSTTPPLTSYFVPLISSFFFAPVGASIEVRMKKEAVKHARSEMIQLIKEGHSVLDILQQQRDTNEHAKDLRLTVTKELYKMRKEGASADEIREYLNRANQILEQSGIESVSEPVKRGRK